MEQAYDLKALGEKLAAAGLPIAKDALEKGAGEAYVAFKAWLKESAALSETGIDDVVVGFVDQFDAYVLPKIDAINGKVG